MGVQYNGFIADFVNVVPEQCDAMVTLLHFKLRDGSNVRAAFHCHGQHLCSESCPMSLWVVRVCACAPTTSEPPRAERLTAVVAQWPGQVLHTHTLSHSYLMAQWDWRKGFQGRFKRPDRGRMTYKNRELVPDRSWSRWTLFRTMVFWTLRCLQKNGAAGKECECEDISKGRWGLDEDWS